MLEGFQFLLVRLKELSDYMAIKTILISIPSGTIKRGDMLNRIAVSISPSGTIKSVKVNLIPV